MLTVRRRTSPRYGASSTTTATENLLDLTLQTASLHTRLLRVGDEEDLEEHELREAVQRLASRTARGVTLYEPGSGWRTYDGGSPQSSGLLEDAVDGDEALSVVAAVVSDGDGSEDGSADGAEVVEMAFDGTNAVGPGRSSGEPSGGSDFLIAPGRARPPPPPAGWVWPREGGVIEVEVQEEEGQPAAWLRATVTAVLEDGWFQALVRTPPDEAGWHDWFSWREEGTDWRRVPPRQEAAAEPSSSSSAAAEPEAAEPEAAEPAEPSAASQRGGAIEAAPAGPAPWSRAEEQHLSEAIRESMPAIHARFAAKEGGGTARSAEELMGRFVAAARWQRAEAAAR